MKAAPLSPVLAVAGLLATLACLAGAPAPGAAQLPLVRGDHVRIVSDTLAGEFTFLRQEGSILRLARSNEEPRGEIVVPIRALGELSVARFEAAAAARRRGAWLGAGAGATAGFVVGFVAGLGTEYGVDAGLGFGIALALPGGLIGALVGHGAARPRVDWELVPLGTRSSNEGRSNPLRGRLAEPEVPSGASTGG